MHGQETNHLHNPSHPQPLAFALLQELCYRANYRMLSTKGRSTALLLREYLLEPGVAFGSCQLLAFPSENAEHASAANLIFEYEVAVNGWQC